MTDFDDAFRFVIAAARRLEDENRPLSAAEKEMAGRVAEVVRAVDQRRLVRAAAVDGTSRDSIFDWAIRLAFAAARRVEGRSVSGAEFLEALPRLRGSDAYREAMRETVEDWFREDPQ